MSKVFITGGARRLGRALSLKFAKDGWDVAFSFNRSINEAEQVEAQIKEFEVSSYTFQAELTNFDIVKRQFDKMIDEFGKPDVVINNAGVFPELENIHQLSVESWDEVIKTNLYVPFYISKLFAETNPINGRIINIGSIGGMQIWKGRIPYHISKNGIIHLTKVLAQELAPNISVNCVNPGTIIFNDEPDEAHVPSIPVEKIPMKELVTPDDIYKAVLFFAQAPLTVTGQSISIDGGYSI
jgi:3-oxoacyl-[acyl-carrier protein] reductase/pteridine reductase